MYMNEIIFRLFPHLKQIQKDQLQLLPYLYREWNDKINVVSRKDINNIDIHHILHSLSIALFFQFPNHCKIMDVGTGGGFPGIPLAILYPEVQFTLVDSIAKKIHVVSEISKSLNLDNVTPLWSRVEDVPGKFDFITGRAVTALPEIQKMLKSKLSHRKGLIPESGIIYLKGGDFTEELIDLKGSIEIFDISSKIEHPFFETKKVVYLQPQP